MMHNDSYKQDYKVIPLGQCFGAILEFDTAKLIGTGHEVEPHTWEAHHGAEFDDEAEYRVTDQVSPVTGCLIAFYVRAVDLDWHIALTEPSNPRLAKSYAWLKAHRLRREMS